MIGDNEQESVELFGRDMVNASDENLKFLKELCDGRNTVSKDEFGMWLLHLMGRVDSSDITVVRHVFGNEYSLIFPYSSFLVIFMFLYYDYSSTSLSLSIFSLHLCELNTFFYSFVKKSFADKFAASSGVDKNGKIKIKDVEVVTGSSL